MIQQVNLYTDELRPRKERLQAGMAVGILVVGVVLVCVRGWFPDLREFGDGKQGLTP